eukprot:m.85566 g.85566  ORF g.85566 m.85566 type:complete len:232 (-) comp19787_c0_seq2:324-1019(-)
MTMCRVVVALLVFAVAGARGATKPTLFGCGVTPYLSSTVGSNFRAVARYCTTFALISSSGACADPSGPELVKQFNISHGTGNAGGNPDNPSPPVQVADVNGSWIGNGVGAVTAASAGYTLDYECAHGALVLPHTSCHCTADPHNYFGDTCDGTCLTAAQCAQFVFEPNCTTNSGNGCMCSGSQTCDCVFNTSKITTETQWAVSCSFPMLVEEDSSMPTANVQCVGMYLEVV